MILIVEDDTFKFERIRDVLLRSASPELRWVRSVQSGVDALMNGGGYKALILDMALPSHDTSERGGAPTSMPSGGLELIFEMSYVKIAIPLIIITQYPEIEVEGEYVRIKDAAGKIQELYGTSVTAVIGFDQNSASWEVELLSALETTS